MAPSFFTKLVKPNSNRDGARSPSPSPTSPTQAHRQPTISISRPSQSTHRPSESYSSRQSDTDSESINPNVTVIPPSPRNSDMSGSSSSTTRDDPSLEDLKRGSEKPRRQHTLSLGSNPLPPSSPLEDEAVTPTPSRPNMSEREATVRPLSHSSSTGNLREQPQNGQANHPRSATVATEFERQQQLRRTPSVGSNKSNKSNRSGLRIKVKSDKKDVASPPRSMHERASTSPPKGSGGVDDAGVGMSPIVESPTKISPSHAIMDVGPSRHTLATSATVPSIPNSALLAAPDKSDAASIYSVGSTTKKRKIFRRLSMKESKDPSSPAPGSASSYGSKSPKRKNTGLAGALAASGLAMANPAVSMPQITPAELIVRDQRSNTVSSHRSRGSVDRTRSPARSRQASLSYPQSELSDRDSFVSGLEGSDEDDDLDLDADDIPVTGFAVASARRNQEFHEMFPAVPEGDYLIEDYGCALQREILIQGRLYISENHICFHANLFGWVTDVTIPMYDVVALDKRMTAFVIPNAIQVTTRGAKYTFTSFLSRDTTFDVIFNVWRLARPDDSASQIVSARGSLEDGAGSQEGANGAVNGKKARPNKVTVCGCGRNGQHYSETAMETVFPGTPEKIYNLMFTSGFIKEFMRDGQKLMDIQISDWEPLPGNPTLLTRNMSYIKPLTASLGPRQTKCELRDEMAFCDFDDYISMVTTTRTPEVPSGGVFSVKTRTCLMWASSVSTKVIITTQVEWTGRSFIKGIVEKSALDGQKTYHVDLEKAMRDYIHRHQSEFIPEGMDVEEVEEAALPTSPSLTSPTQEQTPEAKARELERNARGLQWAYDTFEGAMKVAKQSTEGALELIKDAWDQSSSSTIQYFVIVLLVLSNVWTLVMMGKREEVGRRKEIRRTEEREKWVQGVVTALWDELTATKAAGGGGWPAIRSEPVGDVKIELLELNSILDRVEERVQTLRKSLQDLD
ncbi:GRAM domain-containing protein [Phanerochaete sordida]|uniref:GRAM domain-containing protein n=1 Tax=Phanerochaete sordida TaxID=48140 RepID=A0A9P3G5L6_9APHY|nr:GRAM domain-containing protein [Phanerochaete sordida]